jgi:hypothetical protein
VYDPNRKLVGSEYGPFSGIKNEGSYVFAFRILTGHLLNVTHKDE